LKLNFLLEINWKRLLSKYFAWKIKFMKYISRPAMCVLVVVQVLVHSIDEWSSFSSSSGDDDPKKSENLKLIDYGLSTVLAYVVFGIYCVSSLVFLVGGRKNKGLHAATMELEEEDRPVNLCELKHYVFGWKIVFFGEICGFCLFWTSFFIICDL